MLEYIWLVQNNMKKTKKYLFGSRFLKKTIHQLICKNLSRSEAATSHNSIISILICCSIMKSEYSYWTMIFRFSHLLIQQMQLIALLFNPYEDLHTWFVSAPYYFKTENQQSELADSRSADTILYHDSIGSQSLRCQCKVIIIQRYGIHYIPGQVTSAICWSW